MGLSKIVQISDIRRKIVKKEKQRALDIQASYILLKDCLKFLNMNQLQELVEVKKKIRKTMRELDEMKDNE